MVKASSATSLSRVDTAGEGSSTKPMTARDPSQASGPDLRATTTAVEEAERVIWQGYLLLLKSKGGVRQWKEVWAVLRAKNLGLYKDESVSVTTFYL